MGDNDFISSLATGLMLLRSFVGDDGAASLEADDDPLDFDFERDARNVGDAGFEAFDEDDEVEAEEPGLDSSLSIGEYPMYAGNLNCR